MFIPQPAESKEFQSCPAGTHLGICTRVIDLGTHVKEWQGEKKPTHQLMVSWELPEELMADGRPFSISQFYTWSMHEKSTLRKHLEAWRGATFGPKDFGEGGFDIKNVLGKPCTLNIIHREAGGKTFANVSSVGRMMKGVKVGEPVNELIYLWIHKDRWDGAAFNKLSQSIQQKIVSSPEYGRMMGNTDPDDLPEPRGSDSHDPDYKTELDDDIPF